MHFKRGLFSIRGGPTGEGWVCVCFHLSKGGMWGCDGDWCDLPLCVICSSKVRRLNTAITDSSAFWSCCTWRELLSFFFFFATRREQRDPTSIGPFSLSVTLPCSPLFFCTPTPDASLCFSSQAVGGLGRGVSLVSCSSVGWKQGAGYLEAPLEQEEGFRFLVLYKRCHLAWKEHERGIWCSRASPCTPRGRQHGMWWWRLSSL